MPPITSDRADPAFELSAFGYSYQHSDGGLTDVSLRVERGEFVLVCGRSGGGKSTLLRAAGGLVPHHFGGSAVGEASIAGHDLRESTAAELAAVCGTVMQDPEVQVVMGNVRNEISFPLENLGWEAPAINVAVEETAIALGISDLLGRRTNELSGGQLQRVVLAAAIAARPALVVLDEPTSQLDPVAADELLATLQRLNADRGTTVLLADHRYERALEIADRVLLIEGGRVEFDGSPEQFVELAAATHDRRWLLTPSADLCRRCGIAPLPVGAKATRRALGGLIEDGDVSWTGRERPARADAPSTPAALELRRVSFRYPEAARPALDDVSLSFSAGQRTVLIGANGSGKSTLLRIARSVQPHDGGAVDADGEVALLLQNPNDYLIHERVGDEAPAAALARFGLAAFADRDPRDLSGGERQRLALAIVMQSNPSVLLLDEPTRGMDRMRREELAAMLRQLAAEGVAVVVATHDTEFAAVFAERVVLLGGGQVMADGPAGDVLGGGWHFATEVSRLLPGSGVLTAEQGAREIGMRAARRAENAVAEPTATEVVR